MSGTSPDFEHCPDLANRQLAGSVIWASDESFAERENLIMLTTLNLTQHSLATRARYMTGGKHEGGDMMKSDTMMPQLSV